MLLAPFVVQAASAAEVSLTLDQHASTSTTTSQQQHPAKKMQGYRIQIYSGVKGRESKTMAYAAGERFHDLFPELSVYCKYIQPRWSCRVGDFTTMEEAHRYADLIRKSGEFTESSIVKSTIKYVESEPLDIVDSVLRRWLSPEGDSK